MITRSCGELQAMSPWLRIMQLKTFVNDMIIIIIIAYRSLRKTNHKLLGYSPESLHYSQSGRLFYLSTNGQERGLISEVMQPGQELYVLRGWKNQVNTSFEGSAHTANKDFTELWDNSQWAAKKNLEGTPLINLSWKGYKTNWPESIWIEIINLLYEQNEGGRERVREWERRKDKTKNCKVLSAWNSWVTRSYPFIHIKILFIHFPCILSLWAL